MRLPSSRRSRAVSESPWTAVSFIQRFPYSHCSPPPPPAPLRGPPGLWHDPPLPLPPSAGAAHLHQDEAATGAAAEGEAPPIEGDVMPVPAHRALGGAQRLRAEPAAVLAHAAGTGARRLRSGSAPPGVGSGGGTELKTPSHPPPPNTQVPLPPPALPSPTLGLEVC